MISSPLLRAHSAEVEPSALVEDLASQFAALATEPAGLFLFRSPLLEDDGLSRALNQRFHCPIASCTTAGEIDDEYRSGTTVAVAFSADHFAFRQLSLPDLNCYDFRELPRAALDILESPTFPSAGRFGVLLVDGLSGCEESLVGQLQRAFQIPMIGGSAGDDLAFGRTRVFCEGQYRERAATFTVVETLLPFEIFRVQHFQPSSRDLVITRSEPAKRIVYEIDGAPAARQLARILGMDVAELTPQIFARHPMMLQIGEEWYVRSIQKVNDDGSLSFFCAIDDGLPLTIASGVGLVETLEQRVGEMERSFSRIHLTLGVDCILRRLEIEEKMLNLPVGSLLKRLNFLGFSGYGEQIHSLHVNQTLTAVVLGEKW